MCRFLPNVAKAAHNSLFVLIPETILREASSYYLESEPWKALLTTGNPLNKLILVFALVLSTLAVPISTSGAAKTYLDYLNSAVAYVEEGNSSDAVAAIRLAMATNANDSLSHTALGLALLEGGRSDDARAEFAAAAELDPSSAEAPYGLGLVALKQADLPEAARFFAQAQQTRPDMDMQSSLGYVKWLAGGEFEAKSCDDECALAMRALELMKKSDFAGAKAIWSDLSAKAQRPDFGERLGCSVSFLKYAPMVTTGSPLGKNYKPVAIAKSNLVMVSGNLDLKADLSRATLVRIVSFFVDGRFVGMTNTPPFHYLWDTTATPNGVHTLRISGTDEYGTVVTEKSTNVMVRNKGDAHSGNVAGDAAESIRERLWKSLQLKPSVAAINYNLSLCCSELGDPTGARASLEKVMAANPNYADSAKRLSTLCGPMVDYDRLYKGDGSKKIIALTFDDGPKKDCGRLLDVLKAKDVKATFFVVGKQAQAFPEIVKRMADEGHEIGDHTYSHRDVEYLNEVEVTQEVFKTAALIRQITGREVHFLRPPGGHEGTRLPKVMRRFGITTVFWTADAAKLEETNKKRVYDYVISTARPGGLVLLHNMELCTLQALPDIIDTLRAKGYSFVRLSELRQ